MYSEKKGPFRKGVGTCGSAREDLPQTTCNWQRSMGRQIHTGPIQYKKETQPHTKKGNIAGQTKSSALYIERLEEKRGDRNLSYLRNNQMTIRAKIKEENERIN